MDYVLWSRESLAAFLKAPSKFSQRQFDGIADSFQFEHVDSSFTLFIFADAGLGHSKKFSELRLSQFCLYSNAAEQADECFSITQALSRKSSNPLHARSIRII